MIHGYGIILLVVWVLGQDSLFIYQDPVGN